MTAFVVLNDLARNLQVGGCAQPPRSLSYLERCSLEWLSLLPGHDGGQLRLRRDQHLGRSPQRRHPDVVVCSPVARGPGGRHRVIKLRTRTGRGVGEDLARGRIDHTELLLRGYCRTADGQGELTHHAPSVITSLIRTPYIHRQLVPSLVIFEPWTTRSPLAPGRTGPARRPTAMTSSPPITAGILSRHGSRSGPVPARWPTPTSGAALSCWLATTTSGTRPAIRNVFLPGLSRWPAPWRRRAAFTCPR